MRVPKVIHQIWVGEKLFPERDLMWCESIKRQNPYWRFVIHVENPETVTHGPWDEVRPMKPIIMQYLLDALRERMTKKRFPAGFADLARVEILIEEGGVYFDTDVIGIRPIDDIMENVTLGLSWEFRQHQIGNFFIAATPGHPALIRSLNEMHTHTSGAIAACHDLNPFWITGPKVLEKIVPEWPDCTLFPFPYMSPWNPVVPMPSDRHTVESLPWPEKARVAHLFDSKWTTLGRDSSLPLEYGLQVEWHEGPDCRDEDGNWEPIPDGMNEKPKKPSDDSFEGYAE